jgi:OOP family OmpA-OmpF porin
VSVFDDPPGSPQDYLGLSQPYDPASEEFAELRELLLGGERRQLEEVRRRLDAMGVTPEDLAEHLPEAIALRAGRDRQLARALAPTVESALTESVRRNPRQIATAIFPVLGPAIRKAIAEAMASLVNTINHAIEHSLSPRGIRWRIEGWRTGVPYAQIVLRHALVYRVEQVFLIHADTGLLLGHAAPPELKAHDADLISGMLTAIQDFVADSFAERDAGGLRRFSVGELTVFVERGPEAVIAAVVRGTAPDALLPTLQDTLETIHFQFAVSFSEFAGDPRPFEPAHPLLENCLATVLKTDRQPGQKAGFVWLRWALPVAAIGLVLGVLSWRSRQRFGTAMDLLRATPGIELVSAERSGGRWRVRGLRDPLAADPKVVLAGAGADSSRLDAAWESYLSLEPSLVLARTRATLGAPESVTLALRGDSVYAAGAAPLLWVGRTLMRATLPAGVSHLDLSGVTAELPADLAALRNESERRLVYFDPGSAAISGEARSTLAGVASAFRTLRDAARAAGFQVSLELTGRTDSTGSDLVNESLSRQRVDAARRELLGAGLLPAELDGRGIGTSRPLTARSDADRTQVNRSVSFQVRLQPSAAGRAP